MVFQILLNPVYCLKVLRKIPVQDFGLLLCGNSSPHDLVMSCIQVPPVPIRPTVMQENEGTANQDDITVALSGVLAFNQILQEKIDKDPLRTQLENWENMQWKYNQILNGSAKDPSSGATPATFSKAHKGFEQRLKGKHGRFRGNLNGKRVNFSGRTVISPDPNLRLDEVGIPEYMARILTFPIHVNAKNLPTMRVLVRNGSKHPGAAKVTKHQPDGTTYSVSLHNAKVAEEQAKRLQIGDIVDRHLQNGDPVLFNRQPSLHKMSIMSHKARVLPSRTLRFNECVCTPYNADFDGDEMNIHVPQTYPARAEAEILMLSTRNILTPKNGEVIIGAHQDFITGSYLLSNKDNFFTRAEFDQLITQMLVGKDKSLKIDWPKPAVWKPEKLWTGKQVLSVVLCPNQDRHSQLLNMRAKGKNYTKNEDLCVNDSFLVIHNGQLLAGTVDKNNIGTGSRKNVFCHLFHDCGSDYAADIIYRLTRVSAYFIMHRGFSIGIEDVSPSAGLMATKRDHVQTAYRKCEDLIGQLKRGVLENRPGMTGDYISSYNFLLSYSFYFFVV